MEHRKIVGANILRMLDEQNKTQMKLADFVGVSYSAVTLWVQGQVQIKDEYYDKICQFFHCSKADLLLDKNSPDLLFPSCRPIPILGSICAGDGIICEQDYQGQFFIDSSIRADYCLKVKGDSMSPLINDGDIAFIRKDGAVRGSICAVIIGDEVTLKKVYVENDSYLLVPINSNYQPITTRDAVIVGQCIGHYQPLL